jgi:hypothetical protein
MTGWRLAEAKNRFREPLLGLLPKGPNAYVGTMLLRLLSCLRLDCVSPHRYWRQFALTQRWRPISPALVEFRVAGKLDLIN